MQLSTLKTSPCQDNAFFTHAHRWTEFLYAVSDSHKEEHNISECYVIRLHSISVISCSDSNAARIFSRVSACSIHLRCVACSPSLNALSWYTCPLIDKKKIERQHDCIATSIICLVEKSITSENNAASNEKNVIM